MRSYPSDDWKRLAHHLYTGALYRQIKRDKEIMCNPGEHSDQHCATLIALLPVKLRSSLLIQCPPIKLAQMQFPDTALAKQRALCSQWGQAKAEPWNANKEKSWTCDYAASLPTPRKLWIPPPMGCDRLLVTKLALFLRILLVGILSVTHRGQTTGRQCWVAAINFRALCCE